MRAKLARPPGKLRSIPSLSQDSEHINSSLKIPRNRITQLIQNDSWKPKRPRPREAAQESRRGGTKSAQALLTPFRARVPSSLTALLSPYRKLQTRSPETHSLARRKTTPLRCARSKQRVRISSSFVVPPVPSTPAWRYRTKNRLNQTAG